MYFYIEFEENRFYIYFWSHFWFALPYFRFFDFRQNLEIFSTHFFDNKYKIWYFHLFWFFRLKKNQYFSYSRIHTRRHALKFSKTIFSFFTKGTSKRTNQINSMLGIWPKIVLPLLNGNWVIKVNNENMQLVKI